MNGITNNLAREFIIGVKDVTGSNDLAEAIFQGISKANGGSNNVASIDEQKHQLRIERDPSDPSKIFITKDERYPMLFKEGTIPNPLTDPIKPAEVEEKPWRPLWVQHGTQSGQRIHVYINSMQTKDLKGTIPNEADKAQLAALDYDSAKQAELQAILDAARNMTLDDAKVTTVDNAKIAIRVVEGALEYALNEATTQGAYLQRLEFTDSNVTTMGENVQQAESTIRDADMAREMAEYTKYNILTQSSQAMLAQANQNQSSILSLLH